MTARPVDAVLFDLDGTLVDSLPTIALAMRDALRLYGIEKDVEDIYPLIGPPIEIMAQQLGASVEIGNRIGDEYRRVYDSTYIHQTPPCAGAAELLDALDAAGVSYGIVTNKIERQGRLMLEVMGWTERVSVVLGRDSAGAAAKPDPEAALIALRSLDGSPERAAFVGDTEFDLRCGRNAGLALVIGVIGARTREQLVAEGATHVVDSLLDVAPLVLGVGVTP